MADSDEKPIKGSLKLLLNRFENIKIERENENSSQVKKLEPKAAGNPKTTDPKKTDPKTTDPKTTHLNEPEIIIAENEETEKSVKPSAVAQPVANAKAQPKFNQSLGDPADS